MKRRWFLAAMVGGLGSAAAQTPAGTRVVSGGSRSVTLLRSPAVQRDLQVTPAQREKLQPLLGGGGSRLSKDFGALSPQQRQAEFDRARRENDRLLAAVLSPAQRRRLRQIELQSGGAEVLLDREVASALQLTQQQRTTISGALDGLRAHSAQMQALLSEGGDPTDILAEMQEEQAEVRTRAFALLTERQRAKWRELTGRPLTL